MTATYGRPLKGLFPIAPTPFHDNGDIDFEGQVRVLDCMIDQGVDGICILANYSEQFALTDDERASLLALSTLRTARAETTGDSFCLVAPDEEEMVRDIERVINQRLPRVTLPDLDRKSVV